MFAWGVMGDVNKLFVFKSLLTTPSNFLPLHLKQTFLPIIWIFTEGDGIEFRLPFKIFSTLPTQWMKLGVQMEVLSTRWWHIGYPIYYLAIERLTCLQILSANLSCASFLIKGKLSNLPNKCSLENNNTGMVCFIRQAFK